MINTISIATLNFFPGVEAAGEMFTCVITEIVVFGAFLIQLFWVKHYLTGETVASVICGRVVGTLCGAGMSILQTMLFLHFFPLDDPGITGCVVIFFLIDAALTTTVVYPPIDHTHHGDAHGNS